MTAPFLCTLDATHPDALVDGELPPAYFYESEYGALSFPRGLDDAYNARRDLARERALTRY